MSDQDKPRLVYLAGRKYSIWMGIIQDVMARELQRVKIISRDHWYTVDADNPLGPPACIIVGLEEDDSDEFAIGLYDRVRVVFPDVPFIWIAAPLGSTSPRQYPWLKDQALSQMLRLDDLTRHSGLFRVLVECVRESLFLSRMAAKKAHAAPTE